MGLGARNDVRGESIMQPSRESKRGELAADKSDRARAIGLRAAPKANQSPRCLPYVCWRDRPLGRGLIPNHQPLIPLPSPKEWVDPAFYSHYNGAMAVRRGLRAKALRIHRLLLEHYGQPTWRNPLPALDELVSTILSQNTNDVNRDRAFEALRGRFKTWEAVRDAPEPQVIEAIRPAGLANQKGPRIQAALRAITAERGALDLDFLREIATAEARAWLRRFNGVGPKTAAIVLLFSLGRPAFPVDTHIYRVTGCLGLRQANMTLEQAHTHLERLLPPEAYYTAHLNLIRHGREICHARRPNCPACFLKKECRYYRAAFLPEMRRPLRATARRKPEAATGRQRR